MYADQRYYERDYLLGREPVIPDEEYLYWEKQARIELDKRTFSRLTANFGLITDQVKDCTCELAELLYQAHSVSQASLQEGVAGPLASFSNDGESGTFDLSKSIYTEEGKAKKIREIIYRNLGNTGLLYAGV